MAVEVIKAVGPGSHFLREKHTRQHIRDFPLSPITDEIYLGDERRRSREVALQEFDKINETHHPEPLPEGRLVIGVGLGHETANPVNVYYDDFVVCELTAPFVTKPTPEP